ncbi:MAG: aminotransferase class V-fold PLP-dependent enzyme [Pseudohongiellaceae bacterium]
MKIDLDRCRDHTPATKNLIHFNNAGCALSPSCVTEAVIAHLNLEQEVGGYEAAVIAQKRISGFYEQFARLLNCSPTQIAYIENASRAWDIALYSIDWQEGDQIVTVDNEYVSNYVGLLHLQKQKNIEIVLLPCDAKGVVDCSQVRDAITDRTRMLALTHVSSQRGDIQPAEKIGQIAKEFNLLYLLDACQSAGQIDLDVNKLQCDFLCGTGRKYLRGPRGTGFLYASDRMLKTSTPLFADNHSASWTGPSSYAFQEDGSRFETWERSLAGMIGLAEAVKYACDIGVSHIEERVSMLAMELQSKLRNTPSVTVMERSENISGIVTFQKEGIDASVLASMLSRHNINTSISKQDNAQLDLALQGIGDVNRASIHYYNTTDEIDRFIEAVARC